MSGMMKRILLFECNIFQENQIIALCKKLDISVKTYHHSDDYDAPIGMLNQGAGSPGSGNKLAGPMLVFCGMNQQDVFALIDAWNKAGIPTIDHKAMLTPVNAGWTPIQLYRELVKEHKEMH